MLDPNLDVLLVEDDPVTRRLVSGQLQRLGVQKIRQVENGRAALEEIGRQKPQVVITDWGMPRVNGLQLLQIIRKHDAIKSLPVLMITSRSEKDYILTAAQEGVNAYIVKPFDAPTLEAKLNKILGSSLNPSD
jgi:two-component system chemotaxis response regulator CheY